MTFLVFFSFNNIYRELVMDGEAWRAMISWGRKESDTTERLNWAKPVLIILLLQFKRCATYIPYEET